MFHVMLIITVVGVIAHAIRSDRQSGDTTHRHYAAGLRWLMGKDR